MAKLTPVYQTLEDRCNPDEVELNGAYKSEKSHWLGQGYYFWDRSIRRAHWWGQTWYVGKDYMICEASVICEDAFFFDLYDNPEHSEFFEKYAEDLKKRFPQKTIKAKYVLFHMRKNNRFPYKMMRVESERCGGDNRIPFNDYSFVNTNKAIQICVYDKSIIHNYHVVYPDSYIVPIG